MFKPKSILTNVRPSKTEEAELMTSPTNGMMKLNAPAARHIGVAEGDYVTIVPADVDGVEQLFITKGSKGNNGKDGNPKVAQVGAVLSSTSGTGAGSLQFGSANVWNELKGDTNVKKVYSIAETPEISEGQEYFQLTFVREDVKAARKAKATA